MSHKWGCACAGLVAKVHIQWLNPIKFSKSTPKEHTHIRNNRKAVLKTAAHSATPTQPSYITLRLTPAVCRERTEQLESWTMCVCVCAFGREHNWACELLYECVCLHVRGPIRMHQRLWHKARPQLDLTLRWMPPWRQSDFVWPHTSTEEDMEKIWGPVSLGDYMAPLSSGLNNASNPTVPCHCNLGLLCLEKKSESPYHPTTSGLWRPWWGYSWACVFAWERAGVCVRVYVKERRGMREGDYM